MCCNTVCVCSKIAGCCHNAVCPLRGLSPRWHRSFCSSGLYHLVAVPGRDRGSLRALIYSPLGRRCSLSPVGFCLEELGPFGAEPYTTGCQGVCLVFGSWIWPPRPLKVSPGSVVGLWTLVFWLWSTAFGFLASGALWPLALCLFFFCVPFDLVFGDLWLWLLKPPF